MPPVSSTIRKRCPSAVTSYAGTRERKIAPHILALKEHSGSAAREAWLYADVHRHHAIAAPIKQFVPAAIPRGLGAAVGGHPPFAGGRWERLDLHLWLARFVRHDAIHLPSGENFAAPSVAGVVRNGCLLRSASRSSQTFSARLLVGLLICGQRPSGARRSAAADRCCRRSAARRLPSRRRAARRRDSLLPDPIERRCAMPSVDQIGESLLPPSNAQACHRAAGQIVDPRLRSDFDCDPKPPSGRDLRRIAWPVGRIKRVEGPPDPPTPGAGVPEAPVT